MTSAAEFDHAMPHATDQKEAATPTFKHFNPTKDERVDVLKSGTDDLIAKVKEYAKDGTPEQKRRAALAATNYEQAAMWAVKSLF